MSSVTVDQFNNTIFKKRSQIEIEQHCLEIIDARSSYLQRLRSIVKDISVKYERLKLLKKNGYDVESLQKQLDDHTKIYKQFEEDCAVKINFKNGTVFLKSWQTIVKEFDN